MDNSYGFALILVVPVLLLMLIAFVVYLIITPSEVQAQATAEPTFNAYNSVMALAPLGCPTTPAYR